MATDTARVRLELASGRNESTAPFQYTAERKRKKPEEPATPTAIAAPIDPPVDPPVELPGEPPSAEQIIVDVPLADAASLMEAPLPQIESTSIRERPVVARPPWIASIAAVLAVAGAVWWVMFQRIPDLDPQEIVQRNLDDARQAMADGRYTDPAERSALHYYSTVLALDPANADAVAGIDAIADRHLTDARVLLADKRVPEAGVALEKARRVRPNHNGLAALDKQWRGELRKMLAASTVVVPVESSLAKPTNSISPPARTAMTRRNSEAIPIRDVSQSAIPAATAAVTNEPATPTASDDSAMSVALLASLAPESASTTASNSAVAEPTASVERGTPGISASIEDSSTPAAAPSPLPQRAPPTVVRSVEPKLIRMVQPAYPQEALMRGVEGWVEVSLQVTANGDVVDPRIEETSRGRLFNRAALAAVHQWKYEPRAEGASTERLRVRLQFKQSN